MKLDDGSDHFQESTLQISSVDVGNPANNVIPAKANASFNIRFNDQHSSKSLNTLLRNLLDKEDVNYELDIFVSGESFLTTPGTLSNIISNSVKSVTGIVPELSTTGGTSDARFIKKISPCLEFGLVNKTMHKVDECVSISDLKKLTNIYKNFLIEYFK